LWTDAIIDPLTRELGYLWVSKRQITPIEKNLTWVNSGVTAPFISGAGNITVSKPDPSIYPKFPNLKTRLVALVWRRGYRFYEAFIYL
jgi:hypothetical protein